MLSTESGSNDDHVASAEATTLSSSPPADVKEEVSTSSTEINEVSTLQVGIDLIHRKWSSVFNKHICNLNYF